MADSHTSGNSDSVDTDPKSSDTFCSICENSKVKDEKFVFFLIVAENFSSRYYTNLIRPLLDDGAMRVNTRCTSSKIDNLI